MPKTEGNITFLATIRASAEKAEETSLIMKGRADALRDVAKYIEDNNIVITYPKPEQPKADPEKK